MGKSVLLYYLDHTCFSSIYICRGSRMLFEQRPPGRGFKLLPRRHRSFLHYRLNSLFQPRDISSESLSEEIEYQILDSQDTISTLSQESDSDNERMYIIDKLVELLKLQHIPFPQRSFTDYSHKMKKLYISHISRMIMRLLDILFPGESCVIFNKIVEEAGVSQHTENKNFSGSLLDGLVASYNKAETWQARRQVLSVLTSSLTYSNTMKLIPEVTQYRYYMAQKHALQYGSALPVEPKDTTRARMDLKKLDNFMDFITSPYIVKDLPYGERRIKLSTGETVETPNVIRSMGPAAIITQYKFLSEEQNFTPLGKHQVTNRAGELHFV